MIFTELSVAGAFLIDLDPHADERGLFARAFCAREFAEHGLKDTFVQANFSHNIHRGTLRGLHYQRAPHAEVKLVRCARGALFDVVVDLRPDSPSYGRWAGAELSADNHCALYVPEGCAHGFETLVDDTDAFYLVSAFYASGAEAGMRWDDPQIAIDWPVYPPVLISPKDAAASLFKEYAP
ncbi:dTDP-4-dehydrorhamnose 3,5-epimerase [Acidithiobacillus ferrivorans]|uniref:dTDP-4-dehydrorhamnose 3,5-epimerase n=1 Tax=Acidithiobacillus ferrivorans TaxID=160808 RepID=A0A1B9BW40_9PROT|nr:dTDP-4-dehydrorhamnose 3,5-epimerase [Acidithiobacillus ferrivorans]OCB01948.1 dTDP-4-dehydrorhamnose 3,5-epimerase [Acidithiobacillus ferrivorans]